MAPRLPASTDARQPLRREPVEKPRHHRPVDGSRPGKGETRAAYDEPMTRPTAAFFDLDKTIIAKSSTLAFSREFQAGGLISRRAMLRSAYAQFVFFVGGADHDQMEKMRHFMSQLCAGWDVATVREIVTDTLLNIVDPLVYDEAVTLIEEHRLAGRDIVIVSASGAEVVEPIGQLLGADRVIATRMEIVDGKYTGNIDYYAYAEEKARAITELAETNGYDLERLLRLQRLDHRRPHAPGRRSSLRGQPRQGAAPGRPDQRLAGAQLRPSRRPAAAASTSRRRSRPSRRSPSVAPSRPGASCGRADAGESSAPDPAPTSHAKVNPCGPGWTGLQLRGNNSTVNT